MKFLIYVGGAILAIIVAHFIIKWLEGGYIAENPRKEIGPQIDSEKSDSIGIDIDASVVPA
jgi:hypothetical protein